MHNKHPHHTFQAVVVFLILSILALSCRLPFTGGRPSSTPVAVTTSAGDQTTVPTTTGERDEPEARDSTAENDRKDLPPASFADLLQQGIEQERWTRGEGILHIMEYIAGERPLEGEVLYESGTMIYGLAEEYITKGDNEQIKKRLEELIQNLYRAVKNVEQFAVPAAEHSQGGGNKLAKQSSTDSCGDLWVAALPKTRKTTCLLFKETQAGGATVQVFYPVKWKDNPRAMEVVETSMEVLVRSADTYAQYGDNNDMAVIFSLYPDPQDEGHTATAVFPELWFRDVCPMVIHMTPVNYYQDIYKDTVAQEAFHCFQYKNFFNNQDVYINHSNNIWWMEGTSLHFSNVAVPEIDYEKIFVPDFDKKSQTHQLEEMTYGNFVFFTDWMNHRGNQDLINFLHTLSIGKTSDEQMDELASYPDMDEYFHDFAERYMDKNIPHPGGGNLPIPGALNDEKDITQTGTAFFENILPFQVYRMKLNYLPERRFFHTMDYKHQGKTTMRKENEPGTWEVVKDQLYFRCDEHDPYLVVITSTTKELYHDSEMTIEKIEEAACDGCLLGDWAVEKESFMTLFNNIAASTSQSGEVRITDMRGIMGARFKDDHSFTSIDNELQIDMQTVVPGQGELTVTWSINAVGDALWFTDREMTTLAVTDTDIKADVAVNIPGMGQISGQQLSALEGMGNFGGPFSADGSGIMIGNLNTVSSRQDRSYTCGEETLTLHYPQYGDLVMERLDEPIPLPNLQGTSSSQGEPDP